MRRLIAAAFVSLDGVMQAPGGPDEDRTGDFRFGGWITSFSDPELGRGTAENGGRPFDLVLGRRTYDIFAGYWPQFDRGPNAVRDIAQEFNHATKYVASRTQTTFAWRNSQWLGEDPVSALRAIRQGEGPDLLTQGSSDLLRTLLASDVVDELRLLVYPVLLGRGKRLFGDTVLPSAFTLTRSVTTASGVVLARYERAGEVQSGSFGFEE